MRATEHERSQWITGTREAKFFQAEKCQIRLFADSNLTNVIAAKTGGRAFRGPTQRVKMGYRGIIGQAIDHQRVANALHEVRGVVGG